MAKQDDNEFTVKLYACILVCMISVSAGVFRYQRRRSVVGKWLQRCVPSLVQQHDTHANRLASNLEQRTPYLHRPSVGLVVLTAVYLVVNVTLATNFLALTRLNYYASRCGWYSPPLCQLPPSSG